LGRSPGTRKNQRVSCRKFQKNQLPDIKASKRKKKKEKTAPVRKNLKKPQRRRASTRINNELSQKRKKPETSRKGGAPSGRREARKKTSYDKKNITGESEIGRPKTKSIEKKRKDRHVLLKFPGQRDVLIDDKRETAKAMGKRRNESQ